MKKDLTKYKQILGCGDIHGEFKTLGYLIKERYKITDSVLIVLGDIGMGFHKKTYYDNELGLLNKKIKGTGNTLIFLRGNHDDPAYFDGNYNFSNIFLVPDYTVLNTSENNILCIGGACSIDRTERVLNKTYWLDECCEYKPELMVDLKDIDTVCSHTNPNFVHPMSKSNLDYWINKDIHLIPDIKKERTEMTLIYHDLIVNGNPLKQWFNGHFHWSFTQDYQGIKFNTLSIEEIKIIDFGTDDLVFHV